MTRSAGKTPARAGSRGSGTGRPAKSGPRASPPGEVFGRFVRNLARLERKRPETPGGEGRR